MDTIEPGAGRDGRSRRCSAAAALATAVGLATAVAAPAHAAGPQQATDVERQDVNVVRFYDNIIVPSVGGADRDLVLSTGGTVEDVCAVDNFADVEVRIRTTGTPPDPGATEEYAVDDRVPFTLYDGGGLSVFELLDQECPGVLGDGDTVEPLATGSGILHERLSVRWVEGGDGPVRLSESRNSATGTVVTADGTRLAVRGTSYVTEEPEQVIREVSLEVLNR